MNIVHPAYPPPAFAMTPRLLSVISDFILHHSDGPSDQTPLEIDAEHRAEGWAMIGSYSTCIHVCRVLIRRIVERVTPKRLAKALTESVERRMRRTAASVSRARPCLEPRAIVAGLWFHRFLTLISRMLSLCVPTYRWAGLMQAGVSQ
jgi:hypothetical protein